MENSQQVIAIFGHTGMVGSTLFKYFQKKGYLVIGRSLDNESPNFDSLLENADYIFECVPTPYNWKDSTYDMSLVEAVLEYIDAHNIKPSSKVILKSTMPPKSTERLQEQFPNLNILFNPEFLSEATADADFLNPDRQIIGYTEKSYEYATEVLHLLPESPYSVIMTATEAEIVKYVNNFHGALMIIFANLIYDIAQNMDANFEVIKKAAQASKWVGSPMGRMYWEVLHGGFRGYGGKCFPKDMNNFLSWVKEQGINCEILESMVDANRRLLAEQNLTEQEVEKLSNRT